MASKNLAAVWEECRINSGATTVGELALAKLTDVVIVYRGLEAVHMTISRVMSWLTGAA